MKIIPNTIPEAGLEYNQIKPDNITMPYTLLIHKDADKVLCRMDRPTRQHIAEKIQALGDNPGDPALDIKPLTGMERFRLRVGDWRIIFDRQDTVKVIAIEKIKPRGDVYK